MNIFLIVALYITLVIFPVLLWLWVFRKNDIGDIEPKKMILKLVLIWGGLAALLSIGIEGIVNNVIDPSSHKEFDFLTRDSNAINFSAISYVVIFLYVSIEELVKFITLWVGSFHSKYFTQVIDGVIYGVSVALGFAFVENTIYFISFNFNRVESMDNWQIIISVLIRAVAPLMSHMVTTGIVGLSIGKKKFGYSNSSIVKGLIIAIIIHFIYNFSILFIGGLFGSALGIVAIASGLVYLLKEFFKDENRMVWKSVR